MTRDQSTLGIQGAWEVKRHFALPPPRDAQRDRRVSEHLAQLPGVRTAVVESSRHRVVVVYDINRLSYRQVLEALAQAGLPTPDTWWWRLKGNWLEYLDTTGRENAHLPEPSCCSHPKGLDPPKR